MSMSSELAWDLKLREDVIELSETVGFVNLTDDVPSFDFRSETELMEAARGHESPIERERALWEYAFRRKEHATAFLAEALRREASSAVRWNLLWVALKVGRRDAHPLLEQALRDDDREVRDWAKLFLQEVTGQRYEPEYREGTFVPGTAFDQTLPLQIAGFALINIPGLGQLRANLSPLWFAHLQGRVMACTNRSTFMNDLVIEKCIEGYHPDGSNHYEIYPFSGYSWHTSDGRTQHRYLSTYTHPFYLSGRVEDKSKGVLNLPLTVARGGSVAAGSIKVYPTGDGDGQDAQPFERKVVRGVRGQFFGWAYTSLDHYVEHGEILPGTCQLADPIREETRSLVNTYLCGTFRGKIADHNRDGLLDVNDIACHGTTRGQLDYAADGTMSADPFQ